MLEIIWIIANLTDNKSTLILWFHYNSLLIPTLSSIIRCDNQFSQFRDIWISEFLILPIISTVWMSCFQYLYTAEGYSSGHISGGYCHWRAECVLFNSVKLRQILALLWENLMCMSVCVCECAWVCQSVLTSTTFPSASSAHSWLFFSFGHFSRFKIWPPPHPKQSCICWQNIPHSLMRGQLFTLVDTWAVDTLFKCAFCCCPHYLICLTCVQ